MLEYSGDVFYNGVGVVEVFANQKLREEAFTLRCEAKKAKNDVTPLAAEIADLKNKNAKLATTNTDLSDQNNRLKNVIARGDTEAQKELAILKHSFTHVRFDELVKENARLKGEAALQNDRAKNASVSFTDVVEAQSRANASLRDENKTLLESVRHGEDMYAGACRANQNLFGEIAGLKASLRAETEDLNKERQKNTNLKTDINIYSEEANRLNVRGHQYKNEIAGNKHIIDEQLKIITSLRKDLAELRKTALPRAFKVGDLVTWGAKGTPYKIQAFTKSGNARFNELLYSAPLHDLTLVKAAPEPIKLEVGSLASFFFTDASFKVYQIDYASERSGNPMYVTVKFARV